MLFNQAKIAFLIYPSYEIILFARRPRGNGHYVTDTRYCKEVVSQMRRAAVRDHQKKKELYPLRLKPQLQQDYSEPQRKCG